VLDAAATRWSCHLDEPSWGVQEPLCQVILWAVLLQGQSSECIMLQGDGEADECWYLFSLQKYYDG
jgi:hypothetical protein